MKIEEWIKPGTYHLFSEFSKDTLTVTAQDLLDVAAYVEEHREELEKQAKQDQD